MAYDDHLTQEQAKVLVAIRLLRRYAVDWDDARLFTVLRMETPEQMIRLVQIMAEHPEVLRKIEHG